MDRNRTHAMKGEARELWRNAKELGSHAAHAAREWINERKTDMANRNDRNEMNRDTARNTMDGRAYGAARGGVDHGYDTQSYNRPEYNQNEPMRGYGGGASQGAQGTYGVHQRDGSEFDGRERTYSGEWRDNDRPQAQSGQYASNTQYASQVQGSREPSQYGASSYEPSNRSQAYGAQSSQGPSQYGATGAYASGVSQEDARSRSQGYGADARGAQSFGQPSQAFSSASHQGYAPSSGAQYGQGYGMTGTADRGLGQGYGQSSGYAASSGYGATQYGQDHRGNTGSVGASGYGTYGQPQGLHRGKGPKGYTRSDERIREDLNERLYHDDQIDASDVELSVSAGVVTLSGTVDERRLKYRIEDLAESCSGVVDVTNNLRVRTQATGDVRTPAQSGGSLGGSDSGVDLKGTRSSSATGKDTGTL